MNIALQSPLNFILLLLVIIAKSNPAAKLNIVVKIAQTRVHPATTKKVLDNSLYFISLTKLSNPTQSNRFLGGR